MRYFIALLLAACAASQSAFPLRDPLGVDPDQQPFDRMPDVYWSPLVWDGVDNTLFARVSRGLRVDVGAEAENVNSLDEVGSSSWFENRRVNSIDEAARGGCDPNDMLPDEVADGAWTIDHGKDDGVTLGFRISVPGKGKFLLKADDQSQPERNSAASVIGNAIYHAAGFNTACEQVIYVRRAEFVLKPGLTVTGNDTATKPFDEAALRHVLASSSHRADGAVRMEASKWLPGVPLGPFRYVGTRADDPNDVIRHENRRELRGSRILGAWLNHFDSREQNSFDTWIAVDPARPRGPGFVRHYILDVNDVLGGEAQPPEFSTRLGHSYYLDFADVARDFITFGAAVRPWEREHRVAGREKFGYFTADNFEPQAWKSGYPNPAFVRMTERDAAWMARIIARFTPAQIHAIATGGRFANPTDADYIARVLIARQRIILSRYLTRLSPIADVQVDADGAISATDLAVASGIPEAARASFRVVQRGPQPRPLSVDADRASGRVRFVPVSVADDRLADTDPRRLTVFEVSDGVAAPLEIHTYDLGRRGFRLVGVVRRAP
jgi:hypothetical protein